MLSIAPLWGVGNMPQAALWLLGGTALFLGGAVLNCFTGALVSRVYSPIHAQGISQSLGPLAAAVEGTWS